MNDYPLTLLSENEKLLPSQHEAGRKIIGAIGALVDERLSYVEQYDLDREFSLPAGKWSYEAPNAFLRAYQAIKGGGKFRLAALMDPAVHGLQPSRCRAGSWSRKRRKSARRGCYS